MEGGRRAQAAEAEAQGISVPSSLPSEQRPGTAPPRTMSHIERLSNQVCPPTRPPARARLSVRAACPPTRPFAFAPPCSCVSAHVSVRPSVRPPYRGVCACG